MKLNVFIEIKGERRQVGVIETLPGSGEQFHYVESWLSNEMAFPLSLSLPLTDKPYSARAMRPYFDGLLPEGQSRRAVARQLHVGEAAYVRILAGIGEECIGAVSFYDPENEPFESYRPIAEDAVASFCERAHESTASLSLSDRFSLSGSQAKMSLFRNGEGDWFEALGGAPSTHILKPVSARFGDSCTNEALCMLTAKACGLRVPETMLIDYGPAPLICIQRFDRVVDESSRLIDGQLAPLRLHQEDFCQALGVVPEHKYEENRSSYLLKMAELLRAYSTDPIADISSLWTYVVFNWLIGNCDAHLKNFAVLRSADCRELRLSPLYDVLCTSVYPGLSREMGMSLAGARSLDGVDGEVLRTAAKELMLPADFAMSTARDLADRLLPAIEQAEESLLAYNVIGVEEFAARLKSEVESRAKKIIKC